MGVFVRTIVGFLTLMISMMLVVLSWLFDTEGVRFLGVTLALATAMVAVGLLLDSAEQVLVKPRPKPRDVA